MSLGRRCWLTSGQPEAAAAAPRRWAAKRPLAVTMFIVVGCGGRLAANGHPETDAPSTHDAGNLAPSNEGGAARDAAAVSTTPDASTDTGASLDAPADAAMDTAALDAALPDGPTDLPDGLPTVVCDAGQPVAECVQYFALLSACSGEDYLSEACQPSFIPTSPASLQQIEQVCTTNLQRLQQACQ
jgi:hypothetical protein